MYEWFGKAYEEAPDLYHRASPITYVDQTTAPCLILHGEEDIGVPIEQSISFHEKIQKAGGVSELIRIPNEGHRWFNFGPYVERHINDMRQFLQKHL